MEPEGIYTDIKTFAVHDGPGIRSTMFMKGCSLRCMWCHNPETIARQPELALIASRCVLCGKCAAVCSQHKLENGSHYIERSACKVRGKCAEVCPAGALRIYGSKITVAEAFKRLTADRMFYDTSGGGVTLSGGEPLSQADFCAELLKKLHEHSIHTAMDTCGNAPWDSFGKVIPFTDLFLYDLKHMDSKAHRIITGSGNERILDNLKRLSKTGVSIEIRIPIIPDINDSEVAIVAMGEFLRGLSNIIRVKLLPYHSYAGSKYTSIGLTCQMPKRPSPSREKMLAMAELLRKFDLILNP